MVDAPVRRAPSEGQGAWGGERRNQRQNQMKTITLSKTGGDRATGYTMNNKIVSLPEGLLCTWLDSERQNRWALVDRDSSEVVREGTIGKPGLDNHCGAALAVSGDTVHALIGGHHGPLEHHALDRDRWEWRDEGVAGDQATYPSVATDPEGRVHVFYRRGGQEHWTLNYVRLEFGQWSEPVALIRAHKPGYVYWTNGVTAAPDGELHLTFGNPQVQSDGGIHYGTSHICSADGGLSWKTSSGHPLPAPTISAESVPLMEPAGSEDRYQPPDHATEFEAPGPENYNYQQMNLSNPVVGADGTLSVVLHNNRTGTAEICTLNHGVWSGRPLDVVSHPDSERIHPQSSLAIGPGGRLYACLMVEPTDRCVWGPNGTYLRMATIDDDVEVSDVAQRDGALAQWLPAFGHGAGDLAMLYTRGENAGGFGNNANALETAVILRI